MALKLGLYYCYLLGVSKVWVETNSQLVCHWFNGMGKISWSLQQVWDDIVDLADLIDSKVSHVNREANSVANSLAKL
ncbi:Ribonuclease H domain, partial [Olea europaea subsp. europaea]